MAKEVDGGMLGAGGGGGEGGGGGYCNAIIVKGREGGETDFRAGGARWVAAGEDASSGTSTVVNKVVCGEVCWQVEVSDEHSMGQERSMVTINGVGASSDWTVEFRVHVEL